jgi:hypothetical protein
MNAAVSPAPQASQNCNNCNIADLRPRNVSLLTFDRLLHAEDAASTRVRLLGDPSSDPPGASKSEAMFAVMKQAVNYIAEQRSQRGFRRLV